MLSKQIDNFEGVSIILNESMKSESDRFTVRDLMPVVNDAVNGLAKPPFCVAFETFSPFLVEAPGEIHDFSHLRVLELP